MRKSGFLSKKPKEFFATDAVACHLVKAISIRIHFGAEVPTEKIEVKKISAPTQRAVLLTGTEPSTVIWTKKATALGAEIMPIGMKSHEHTPPYVLYIVAHGCVWATSTPPYLKGGA
jgi:hypothetical protein